jgi:hypothetical protein
MHIAQIFANLRRAAELQKRPPARLLQIQPCAT